MAGMELAGRGLLEQITEGNQEMRDGIMRRELAAAIYAPKRKRIVAKRIYQVEVNGKPETGPGFTSEAWRTKADAIATANERAAYFKAVGWKDDEFTVGVKISSERVVTLKERCGRRFVRNYAHQGEGVYLYSDVSI